jgi:predicted glutamine amidotransferase
MCELFGMSANRSVTVQNALEEFRLRGGQTADNPDGWGLAWWKSGTFHLAKEPAPAYQSALFESLCDSTCAHLVIAHVRKARFPPINTVDNTHPFRRVCCGKEWVFAHNGLVPDVVDMERASNKQVCYPAGETDSEYAFCHLLSYIAQNFQHSPSEVTAGWFPALAMASELIALHGKFNFLMSDGEHLIAYGHDRLHYLEQNGTNTPGVAPANCAMVATESLHGNANWTAFEPGELRIYRFGKMVANYVASPTLTT